MTEQQHDCDGCGAAVRLDDPGISVNGEKDTDGGQDGRVFCAACMVGRLRGQRDALDHALSRWALKVCDCGTTGEAHDPGCARLGMLKDRNFALARWWVTADD
jgi:hypothetical protein